MRKIAFSFIVAVLAGCTPYSPEDEVQDKPYTGPGTEEWGEVDLSCSASSDCLTGEVCSDGFCQVDRCGGDQLETVPPLGADYYFQREDEIALADSKKKDGSYYLDAFDPRDLVYEGSYDLGNESPVDIAGGALWGARPQAVYAAAFEGSRSVDIAGSSYSYKMPMAPIALAAADTDLDGLDELLGVSENGKLAVCDVDDWDCEQFNLNGNATMIDLAAADVDGDALAEVVLLLDIAKTRYIYVYNLDNELTGQEESWYIDVSSDVIRISAGDLDDDRMAEIVALKDGGGWGVWDDHLEIYLTIPGQEHLRKAFSHETDHYGDGLDLELADQDGDGKSEIYLLNTEARVITYTKSGTALLEQEAVTYSPSIEPNRIAAADHNGDAPIAELSGETQSCQGNPVPVMLMMLPPYDGDVANGTSRVGFSSGESTSNSERETVSLGISVDMGYSAGFDDFFSAKVSSKLGWRVSASTTNTTDMYIGTGYTLIADPGLYGPYYGGVVLSWGCYDGYEYTVDDPNNHLGGVDGEDVVFAVPTGGGSSIWSTPRYNAMAAISPDLPEVTVPYRVGKVDSYPTSPEKLDGTRLKKQDMLFTEPPIVVASDVSRVSWTTRVSESQTNSSNTDLDVSTNSGVTVAGVSVGVGVSAGYGSGYSIRVGQEARFSGTLPPLPDNPSTPEDEYSAHSYGLKPYVYVQDYKTGDGAEASYYVQTYTVEQ